jgi:hypothetical protein
LFFNSNFDIEMLELGVRFTQKTKRCGDGLRLGRGEPEDDVKAP